MTHQEVTLRDGSTELSSLAAVLYMKLERLLEEHPIAFGELARLAHDPKHTVFGAAETLKGLGLIEDDPGGSLVGHRMHDSDRAIVKNATVIAPHGDVLLRSPVKPADDAPQNFGNTAKPEIELRYAIAEDWHTEREVQVVEHCQWLKGKTLGPAVGGADSEHYAGVYPGDDSRYTTDTFQLYALMREALARGDVETVQDAMDLCEKADRGEIALNVKSD